VIKQKIQVLKHDEFVCVVSSAYRQLPSHTIKLKNH